VAGFDEGAALARLKRQYPNSKNPQPLCLLLLTSALSVPERQAALQLTC
jgi:hypothetical protein